MADEGDEVVHLPAARASYKVEKEEVHLLGRYFQEEGGQIKLNVAHPMIGFEIADLHRQILSTSTVVDVKKKRMRLPMSSERTNACPIARPRLLEQM